MNFASSTDNSHHDDGTANNEVQSRLDKSVSSALNLHECSDRIKQASAASRELSCTVTTHKEGKRFPKSEFVSKLDGDGFSWRCALIGIHGHRMLEIV